MTLLIDRPPVAVEAPGVEPVTLLIPFADDSAGAGAGPSTGAAYAADTPRPPAATARAAPATRVRVALPALPAIETGNFKRFFSFIVGSCASNSTTAHPVAPPHPSYRARKLNGNNQAHKNVRQTARNVHYTVNDSISNKTTQNLHLESAFPCLSAALPVPRDTWHPGPLVCWPPSVALVP